MSSNILIISKELDMHIPFVTKHLQSAVVVVDPAMLINGVELSYKYHDGQSVVIYDGRELTDIKSVWYRKPTKVRGNLPPMDDKYRQYSESAILSHVQELYMSFPEAFWMSDFFAIRQADFKGRQMRLAVNLGFKVPETLITSDSAAAQAFIDARPITIVKSSAESFPTSSDNKPTMFYSTKIRRGEDFDIAGLHLAPAIFQAVIEQDFELRVTVVGDRVFAAAVRLSGLDDESEIRDWRIGHMDGKVEFEAYDLPKKVELQCVALVRQLGLAYGAIDLIVDRRGQLWFLENNPNGQWAFVEEATGQPIGRAIAASLERAGN